MRPPLSLLTALLSLAGWAAASDFPTIKTALPDLGGVAAGSTVPTVDLRNYFEITSITRQVVQFRTTMGNYNVEMRPDAAPLSVANFVNSYVSTGRYSQSFIHRSDKGLGVIQGGGYLLPSLDSVTKDAPIALEYNLPNVRGSIAMARTSALNSATSEWFINTVDNTTTLGAGNNGGYAVFGRITGTGMAVVDAIAALPVYAFTSPYGQLPLTGYTPGNSLQVSNFVVINAAEVVPLFPAQAGQNAVVSFTVSSSNPAVAAASVSGSALTVSTVAGQSGFSDITVTATDTNGNSTQDTFRVTTVAPPPEIVVQEPAETDVPDGGNRSYGTVNASNTVDRVFTVKNTGQGALHLTGSPVVSLVGDFAFQLLSVPATTIAPGGSSSFIVRFTGVGSGARSAVLHIANDDPDENPFDINLTATVNAVPHLYFGSAVTLEAAAPAGTPYTFSVTSDDAEDGALVPIVNPPSGTVFPIGDTTVNISATDSNGATTSSFFVVSVRDTTPPQISGTFSPVAVESDRSGTAVAPDYRSQAVTSDLIGVTSVTQNPAPGTPIAEGTVPFTLTARDAADNTADVTFNVLVSSGIQVLAQKDGPVPGAGVDARIPAGSKWTVFGAPALADDTTTQAGWLATVTYPPAGAFSGIFSGPVGSAALRLRTGEVPTDALGAPLTGLTFSAFRTPVFAGSDFAVHATVKGKGIVAAVNDTGLWVQRGVVLKSIARVGAAAPGAGAAKFKAIVSYAMPVPGTIFFTATLNAAAAADLGLWRWTEAGGTQLVLREGTPLDVGTGASPLLSFKALTAVAGSPGHGRYDESVPSIDVQVALANGIKAVTTVSADGVVHPVKRSGVSDETARSFLDFGVPSSPGASAAGAVLATLKPSTVAPIVTAANNRSIFDFASGAALARTGATASDAGTAKFLALGNPVTGFGHADERTTAFNAMLTGTTTALDSGLWVHTPTAGLKLLAREGTAAAGIQAARWASFSSLALMDGRGPIFTATLLPAAPLITTANNVGLWATDSAGGLRCVIRTGDRIGTKKIQSFVAIAAVATSPGQRRTWAPGDAKSRLIYRAAFTDGSSAIVATVVP